MHPAISLFMGFLLVGFSTVVIGQASSDSDSCGDETTMTFEGWRKWTKVIPNPVISKGHSNNWVGIYVDQLAKETYLAATGPYPECARIVKPVYTDATGTEVQRLTIMVKMPSGYDPEDADWWYGMYDASGASAIMQGKLAGCIICHRQAADTDYLFSKEVLHANKQ
jgi:hypothetical protein